MNFADLLIEIVEIQSNSYLLVYFWSSTEISGIIFMSWLCGENKFGDTALAPLSLV